MIIDYKSGREPDNLCHEIRIGFRLQPLLYPWLQRVSGQNTDAPIRFSYVFFGKSPVQEKTISLEEMRPVEDWLRLFADILAKGVFIPCSNEALELLGIERAEPCQFCEYGSVCRRFERQSPARMARFLQELLPERLAKFEGMTGGAEHVADQVQNATGHAVTMAPQRSALTAAIARHIRCDPRWALSEFARRPNS